MQLMLLLTGWSLVRIRPGEPIQNLLDLLASTRFAIATAADRFAVSNLREGAISVVSVLDRKWTFGLLDEDKFSN